MGFRSVGENTPVEDVRSAIKRAMADPDVRIVELYYSGHGTFLAGDWCFENSQGDITNYITFEEIVGMWQEAQSEQEDSLSGMKDLLILNCDCCYAGVWVTKATKLADPTIMVRASCGDTEISHDTAAGGAFTQEFAKAVESNPRANPFSIGVQYLWYAPNPKMRELFLVGRPLSGTPLEQRPCLYQDADAVKVNGLWR